MSDNRLKLLETVTAHVGDRASAAMHKRLEDLILAASEDADALQATRKKVVTLVKMFVDEGLGVRLESALRSL